MTALLDVFTCKSTLLINLIYGYVTSLLITFVVDPAGRSAGFTRVIPALSRMKYAHMDLSDSWLNPSPPQAHVPATEYAVIDSKAMSAVARAMTMTVCHQQSRRIMQKFNS